MSYIKNKFNAMKSGIKVVLFGLVGVFVDQAIIFILNQVKSIWQMSVGILLVTITITLIYLVVEIDEEPTSD